MTTVTVDSNTIIEVRPNNLFANGYHVEFPADGEGMLIRDKYKITGDRLDEYHTLVEGQALDQLAWQYYKGQLDDASKYWGVIADANGVHNPFDMSVVDGDGFLVSSVGKDFLIPDIQKVKLLK